MKPIKKQPNNPCVCIVCHAAKPDLQFDEFLGGNICDECAMKREIGNLKR